MLHDISILNTASSFFNNIALVSPFFLLVGLLTIPLYVMVYKYGLGFVSDFGWNKNNLLNNICLCTAVVLVVYSILFGGNYNALRDHFSTLPFLLAIILFGLSAILAHKYDIRNYIKQLKIANRVKILILPCLLLLIAFSGLHTWWGILLQLSSCVCGYILGSKLKHLSLPTYLSCIIYMYTICILMQPEFFRFGQLGNLTLIHLIFIIISGLSAISVLITKINYKNTVMHTSIFTKTKWFFRIMLILLLILFILTEAVPVFIALTITFAINEMLTIKQYKNAALKNQDLLYKKSIAILLICFGTMITCPIITAGGFLYLCNTNTIDFQNLKKLL